jgi:hypothetical protein
MCGCTMWLCKNDYKEVPEDGIMQSCYPEHKKPE